MGEYIHPQYVEGRLIVKALDLGIEFEYVAPKPDYERDLGRWRHIVWGSSITMYHNQGYGTKKGSYGIGADWAKDHQGGTHLATYREEENLGAINVALTKTPDQISADIRRRLLPDFLRLAKLNSDRIDSQEAYWRTKSATGLAIYQGFEHTLRLTDCITNPPQYSNSKTDVSLRNIDGPRIEIKVGSDGKSDVTLDNLTADQVRAVVGLLRF